MLSDLDSSLVDDRSADSLFYHASQKLFPLDRSYNDTNSLYQFNSLFS